MELVDKFNPPPKNPWKLNTFLSKSPSTQAYINAALREFVNFNAPSVSYPEELWSTHKADIRELFIQLATKAKKTLLKTILLKTKLKSRKKIKIHITILI